jgi:hypothetical protein
MKKLVCLLIASCLALGILLLAVADVNHGKGPYKTSYGGYSQGDGGHDDAGHGDDEHGMPAANEALRFYIF